MSLASYKYSTGFHILQVLKLNKETGDRSWFTEAVRPRRSAATTLRAKVKAAVRDLPRLEKVYAGMEVSGIVTRYDCLFARLSAVLFPTTSY